MAKKSSKSKTVVERPTAEYTMVGYGTFITRRMFRPDSNPRVVTIMGFRRVFNPNLAGFPFVLPDPDGSFKGIAFDVKSDDELREKDRYEGCGGDPLVDGEGLYFRTETTIIEPDGTATTAWIYVPTKITRDEHHVTLAMDDKDLFQDKVFDVIKYTRDDPELEWLKGLLPDDYVYQTPIVAASDDDDSDDDID